MRTMKKSVCILLILAFALSLAACGGGGGSAYGVRVIETLVEQEYSLAFRLGDPTADLVVAALEVLMAEGTVDELAIRWFGSKLIDFDSDIHALDEDVLAQKQLQLYPREFIIGVDINSFPMAYITDGSYWGFDVQLAMILCERLNWTLRIQSIEKENVYIELSSGNIDCAWGGIALDPKDAKASEYYAYGPYVKNDIVIATRNGTMLFNRLMLSGKRLAMCSTPEALDALNADPRVARRLKQITRLAGGASECFQYLFSGKCDAVLTDTTAIAYINCH